MRRRPFCFSHLSVTELVDHDVVEDLRGCQQDQAVEIQIPRRTAASPAGLLAPNCDIAVGDADDRGEVLDALGNGCGSSLLEGAQLLLCEGGDRIGLFLRTALQYFGAVDADPIALFHQKALDLAAGEPERRAHQDLSVRPDLYRQRLSSASNEFVFHI